MNLLLFLALVSCGVVFAVSISDCPSYARKDIWMQSEILGKEELYQYKYGKKGNFKRRNRGIQEKEEREIEAAPIQQIVQSKNSQSYQQQTIFQHMPNQLQSNLLGQENVEPTTTEPISTTPEPEEITLWHLYVPKGAREISFIDLENLASPVMQKLSADDIKNRSESYSEYQIKVDITDVSSPTEGRWYLVCIKRTIIQGPSTNECAQCNMVKANGFFNYNSNKPIKAKLVRSRTTQVVLAYDVLDYPLFRSMVTSTAIPVDEFVRCHDKRSSSVSVTSPILPFTVTEVKVEPLQPSEKYVITSQLVLNNNQVFDLLKLPRNTTVSSGIISGALINVPRACEEKGFSFSIVEAFEVE